MTTRNESIHNKIEANNAIISMLGKRIEGTKEGEGVLFSLSEIPQYKSLTAEEKQDVRDGIMEGGGLAFNKVGVCAMLEGEEFRYFEGKDASARVYDVNRKMNIEANKRLKELAEDETAVSGMLLSYDELEEFRNLDEREKELFRRRAMATARKKVFMYGYELNRSDIGISYSNITVGTIHWFSLNNRPYAEVHFKDGYMPGEAFYSRTSKVINDNTYFVGAANMDLLDEFEVKIADETQYVSPKNFRITSDFEQFYRNGHHYFVKFTDSWYRKVNDGEELVIVTPNLRSTDNDWGLTLQLYEDHVLGADGIDYYMQDNSNEVLEWFANDGKFSSRIHIVAMKEIQRRKKSKDEKDAETVKACDALDMLNDTLRIKRAKLFHDALHLLGVKEIPESMQVMKEILEKIDRNFKMDCGFIYFFFTEEEMKEAAITASKNLENDSSHYFTSVGEFGLDLGFATQSTTILKALAKAAVAIFEEGSDCPKVFFRTALD